MRASFAVIGVLVLVASCSDPSQPGAAMRLQIVSGNAQVTIPGAQVPRPLVVRAVDAAGAPVRGTLVHWTTTSGNGAEFQSDTSRTDAHGLAYAVWHLGVEATQYAAAAQADSVTEVTFTAAADPASLSVTAVPDTLKFRALEDTLGIKIRVRSVSPAAPIDTLLNPDGWSGSVSSVAKPIFTGTFSPMVLKSERNGSESQTVRFGTASATVRVVVQQVSVGLRVVRTGTSQPAVDTILIPPDTNVSLGVVAVDARGKIMEGTSAEPGVTWHSSNSGIATVSSNGVVRGVADGVAIITATTATQQQLTARVRIWTMSAKSVVAGQGTTCALLVDGSLACWGFREVANNSALNATSVPEPRKVGPFASLTMSDEGACALTGAGAASCWGRNEFGTVGNGTFGDAYVAQPAAVSGGLSFASISPGGGGTCALTFAGKAYCWGMGYDGRLGDGSYGAAPCYNDFTCSLVPKEVSGGLTFTRLSSGTSGHACGITADGRGYCWGTNNYGQLGSPRVDCAGWIGGAPNNSKCSTVPVEIASPLRWKSIATGGVSSCGITTDDTLYCWGMNAAGILGVPTLAEGPKEIFTEPQAVAPSQRFTSVTIGGFYHACAIDTAGDAWCWGNAFAGKLGIGSASTTTCTVNGACERAPVRVAGGLKFKSLALAWSHSCGMTTIDVVYCWGSGDSGALGSGSNDDKLAPNRVTFQRP